MNADRWRSNPGVLSAANLLLASADPPSMNCSEQPGGFAGAWRGNVPAGTRRGDAGFSDAGVAYLLDGVRDKLRSRSAADQATASQCSRREPILRPQLVLAAL